MKLWLDEVFLGMFENIADIEAKLADWKTANSECIFYLYEFQGVPYSFEDTWREFIKNNIGLDEEVKIITSTPEKLRLELVNSTEEYLDRVGESIKKMASQFYAGPDKSDWEALSDFLEGLDFICQALTILNCVFDRQKFDRMLTELMQAMESQDVVTVADLLNYEWSEWLTKVKNELIFPNN